MDWFFELGYWGLFVGTFLAGTFLALSSDVLFVAMLLAGGDPWISLVCAAAGNALGASTSYWLAWFARLEWIERWFRIRRETMDSQRSVVARFGFWLAFFSWLPIVGQLFLIALGLWKVRPAATMAITFVGCVARFLTWTLLYLWQGAAFVEWIKGLNL